ncbi:MAG: hypothetical protein K1X66_06955 [Verrucomicrobiae bacterium]|nr:hypothetical protein [Verrucomicrobiae bacterium]
MGLFGFGSENDKGEEKKESSIDSAQNASSSDERKPTCSEVTPRLKALPSGLKKVSAGSISLSSNENNASQTSSLPVEVSPASSEDMVSESQRILASLASLTESEPVAKPEEKKQESIVEQSTSHAQTFISSLPSVVISESFSSVSQDISTVAERRQRAYRALSRWLNNPTEIEVDLVNLPKILLKNSEIHGAAIIDQEGLILGLETSIEINRKVLANLVLKLFYQCRFAAEELDLVFRDQTIVSLGELTLQISHWQAFYLITFHQHLPSEKLLHRLRKTVRALARVEMGV